VNRRLWKHNFTVTTFHPRGPRLGVHCFIQRLPSTARSNIPGKFAICALQPSREGQSLKHRGKTNRTLTYPCTSRWQTSPCLACPLEPRTSTSPWSRLDRHSKRRMASSKEARYRPSDPRWPSWPSPSWLPWWAGDEGATSVKTRSSAFGALYTKFGTVAAKEMIDTSGWPIWRLRPGFAVASCVGYLPLHDSM